MNLQERADALSVWLMDEFPPPGPTRVRWVAYIKPVDEDELPPALRKQGDHAECWLERGRCYVDLSRRAIREHNWLIETLIHEWAHLISAKAGQLERRRRSFHDSEWGIAYARIYRAYFEDGGWLAVREIHKQIKRGEL